MHLVKTLQRFIRMDSVTTRSDARLARLVGSILKRGGFKVSYQVEKKRGISFVNVIGQKGRGPRPLLICSHLDTVPPGDLSRWTKTSRDPWKAVVRGDKVYGLGSADDKASMVAMLAAGLSVREKDLKKPLLVMGTYGEESGMGGARLFTRKWKGAKPCLAIAGEPTNLEITYRHKGIGVVGLELHTTQTVACSPKKARKIFFKGIQGHSSRPWLGDNALEKAARYLLADKKGGLCVTDFSGGHAANIIPGESSLSFCSRTDRSGKGSKRVPCFSSRAAAAPWLAAQRVLRSYPRKDRTFKPSMMTSNFGIARVKGSVLSMTFDFRLLPGQDAPFIFRKFQKYLLEELRACPGIRLKMWLERDNPPLDQLLSDPLPRLAKKWLQQNHLPQKLTVKPACTEGGFYNVWGVPAVIFGPGESARNIHAPNECVSVRQIEKAARFYKSVIQEVCVLGRS